MSKAASPIPTTFWHVGVMDVYKVNIVAQATTSNKYIVEFSPPRDDVRFDQMELGQLCERNGYYASEKAAYQKLISKTERFLEELNAHLSELSS